MPRLIPRREPPCISGHCRPERPTLHGLWRIRAYLHLLPGYSFDPHRFTPSHFRELVSGAGQVDASQDEDVAVG